MEDGQQVTESAPTGMPSIEEFMPEVAAATEAPAAETEPAAETPPAVEEPPRKPKAAEFSALAKKERALLNDRKELDATRAKYSKAEEAVSKKDAIAALESLGLNFDEALQAYIDRQTVSAEPDDPVAARITALETEIASRKAADELAKIEAAKVTQTQAAQTVISEIGKLIAANAETFDRVSRFEDSAEKIYDALSMHWVETGGQGDAKQFIEQNFQKAAKILEDHYESEYQRLTPRARKTEIAEVELARDPRPRTLTNDTITGQTRVTQASSLPFSYDEALADALASLKR